MAKRKRKGAALPRLTLLAYSRQDLLRFTESVEKLVGAVHDLQVIVAAMPKPRKLNAVPKASLAVPVSADPPLFNV